MNLRAGIYKRLYWPICRRYARHILGDQPADALFRFLCSVHFWTVYRYWPNFLQPSSFAEKLWNRMIHQRDPAFTMLSDKIRVRDYVSSKVSSEYLIPLLWTGDDPAHIPYDKLPSKFVIKTNHGAGYNIIVPDKDRMNKGRTGQQLTRWLGENFGRDKYLGIAWAYKNIKPEILIETYIDDSGKSPVDYKFYCFSGRVEILTLHFDRFEGHKTKAFNRDFEPYVFDSQFKQYPVECERPDNFSEMVRLAEALSADFDFMRVDLYTVRNKIYFSELTLYPGGVSALRGFDVASLDKALGDKWKPQKA